MKIINYPNFVVLQDEQDDLKNFAAYAKEHISKKFQGSNVVIDLLKYTDLKLEELLLFLETSTNHRKNKKSFVFVNNGINIDDVPAELVVVPTLQEAEDIIEMEEIERDLGF